MAKFSILQLPNPLLKQVCKEVTFPLNEQTIQNIQNLKSAFRQSFIQKQVRTLGLAAPQISVLQRFFIMPKSLNFAGMNLQLLKSVVRNFKVYINPKIITRSDNQVMIPQNCLSVGSDVYEVHRSQNITVEYYNTEGSRIEEKLTGIRARVFLHQNDHLDGITMEERGKIMDEAALILHRLGIKLESKPSENLQKQSL